MRKFAGFAIGVLLAIVAWTVADAVERVVYGNPAGVGFWSGATIWVLGHGACGVMFYFDQTKVSA